MQLLKKIIVFVLIIYLNGCNKTLNHANTPDVISNTTYNQTAIDTTNTQEQTVISEPALNNINNSTNKKPIAKKLNLSKYVSDIGNNIINVSDIPDANYQFILLNISEPKLTIKRPNIINISSGLIKNLSDEAELASVLSIAITELHKITTANSFSTSNASYAPNHNALVYTSRAGYDPQALVDLQQKYVELSKINPNRNFNWLRTVFPVDAPDDKKIHLNQQYLDKLPKGLQRGKNRFIQYKRQI